MRGGRAARASRCSSSSTTRRAARDSILHGDAASEAFLSEIVGVAAARRRAATSRSSPSTSTASRVGLWRLLRLFERRRIPLTVFAVAMALERTSGGRAGHASRPATRSRATAGAGSTTSTWTEDDRAPAHAPGDREHSARHRAADRWAGTQAGSAPIPGASSSRKAASSTTPTPIATTCRTGRRSVGKAAPGRPLHARQQRHAVRHPARFQQRRRLPPLSQRCLRRALRRGGETRRRMMSIGLHCGWSAGPAASRRSSAFSTTCRSTIACGSAAGSTSPATGMLTTRPPAAGPQGGRHEPRAHRSTAESANSDGRRPHHGRPSGAPGHGHTAARPVRPRVPPRS